jgi:LPS export ABC transporter protein LptC
MMVDRASWGLVLPIAALAVIALGSLWLVTNARTHNASRAGDTQSLPDIIIDNFAASKLDAGGETRFRLKAQNLTHYGDGSAELANVVLQSFEPGQPAVDMRAPRGKISRATDGSDEVRLFGDVTIQSREEGRFPSMLLNAPEVLVWPDLKRARTIGNAVLTSARGSARAARIDMDLTTRVSRLESVEATLSSRR